LWLNQQVSCAHQNMWWRMMLKSLFSWWILRRMSGSVRKRLT
jgi:hypothetical protein